MGTFKPLMSRKTSTARSVRVVPPSAFADTWSRRPLIPQKIGLRLISETELTAAQSGAASSAWESVPAVADQEQRLEIFNDFLMTNVLAQVCCSAETGEPFFAPVPEALIREALTPGGIRHLWDAYQALSIADGELSPEATDDELKTLGAKISDDFGDLDDGAQRRVRKLVKALLEEFR